MRSRRAGFTLIEMLIVALILGILTALSLPSLSTARERSYYSRMRSDLKNLQIAQELYYEKHLRYSADAAALGYATSPLVELGGIQMAGDVAGQGWSASATHRALPPGSGCVIYGGRVDGPITAAGATATEAGVAACTE